MSIDLTELRGYISDMYSDVAQLPRGDFHFPTGRPLLEQLGYETQLLDRIPPRALESFAGVGFHFGLAPLKAGERVLDVGSGAGTDVFYAALSVGETGSVVGVDMTDAMLEKARRNLAETGLENVRFEQGYAEELPEPDGSVDVVISNGVINLSPSKEEVLQGIHRVLAPGGRLMFSDIVTGVELPPSVRENCELWAECIGGAVEQDQLVRMLGANGFNVEKLVVNERYRFTQESTLSAAAKFQVHSVSILAYRR